MPFFNPYPLHRLSQRKPTTQSVPSYTPWRQTYAVPGKDQRETIISLTLMLKGEKRLFGSIALCISPLPEVNHLYVPKRKLVQEDNRVIAALPDGVFFTLLPSTEEPLPPPPLMQAHFYSYLFTLMALSLEAIYLNNKSRFACLY